MPSGDMPSRPTRRRRWLARVLYWCLALGLFGGTVLLTGWPQRIGAGLILSSQLGGAVRVGSLALGNPLVAGSITLASTAADHYAPLLEVDRAEVAYQFAPENGRHLGHLLFSGVDIALEQGATDNNFQFLLDRFSRPGEGGDATAWIPEAVDLEAMRLRLRHPEFDLSAESFDIHAKLESPAAGYLRLGAPAAMVTWSAGGQGGETRQTTGAIALNAAWNADGADLDGSVELGTLARLKGTFTSTTRAGVPHYALSIAEARVEEPIWSRMLNGLSPITTRFDTLEFRDSDVQFHVADDGVAIDQATVDGTFTGFAVGPEEAPFYEGPLKIALRGNYGNETELAGTITLRDQLALQGSVQLKSDGLKGTFGWEPWPREDLIALTPPAYGGILSALAPLARLGARGTIVQSPDSFMVDGALTADFGGDAPMDIPVALSWSTVSGQAMLTVSAEADMNGARLKSTTTIPQAAPVRVENTLTAVSPNAWSERILGKSIAPGLAAALTGRVALSLITAQPLEIDLDLSSAGFGYGSMILPAEPPVALAGKMTYDTTSGRLAGTSLKLAQDGTVDLAASKWSLDLPQARLDGALAGTFSLDTLAGLFAWPGLSGTAAIAGQLRIDPAGTHFTTVSLTSEDALYGDWGVPYGSQLAIKGDLGYDRGAGALTLAPVEGSLGDGTGCVLNALVVTFARESEPTRVDFSGLAFQSDMDVLVRRGLLAAVTGGHASLKSEQLSWTGEAFTGQTTWALSADTLTFPEKMGTFEALQHTGTYNPGSGETGGGPLSVGPFKVYEVPFGATSTEVTVTADSIACRPFETAFLGGLLAADGELKYREAGYPGTVRAEAKQLDLEQFTQTFKPPDVVMTGKVNGTVALTVSAAGLVDLDVDLTASENLTLNQAAVRQILMQQMVNDAVGSKQIQKVIEKVIGKDEQRAFDRAVLDLRLEDGLVVGVARLESKNLDVTVDIKAEPEAILQAIQSAAEEAR